jgi:two-component system, OmpR family, response regulator
VRALVRRGAVERPSRLVVGDLELDPAGRVATRAGVPIALTATEFALLEYFMRYSGTALGRRRIVDHVWDCTYQGDSNIVDVFVRSLREKVDRPFDRASLQTVRGVGYRLVPDPVPAHLA